MLPELLYQRNEFLAVGLLFLVLPLVAEGGFRHGRSVFSALDAQAQDPLTMLEEYARLARLSFLARPGQLSASRGLFLLIADEELARS
jgi:hypothetical protein